MLTERIGKYRIIAKLGQGGMARVFLTVAAGPAGFNKLLVVKELKEDLNHDPDFLEMFLNEARLAARLNHPNVVQTYEVGSDGPRHFLAMDYLEGQPLHGVLKRVGRLSMPVDLHVRILADTLAGLHYAHTLADFDGTPLYVVHRDVSPQNVFVTYDGQAKLVDFGIAKARGASTTTQEGVFKGKLSYVAPEQAGGVAVDARADIFSVGVMLWEAIAGRKFAQGESETVILARRLSGSEPRIREEVPDVDPYLADICDRAMAQDPNQRYATAAAFRDDLESFLDRSARRVGAREVADLMAANFESERSQLRQIIDQQMKQVMRETQQALPVPTLPGPNYEGTPVSNARLRGPGFGGLVPGQLAPPPLPNFGSDSAPPSHGSLRISNITGAHDVANSSRLLTWIGFGLAGSAVLALLLVVMFLKGPGERQEPVPASGSEASSDEKPPATEKVKVIVRFGPNGATAKLDGAPLGANPFEAVVDKDGSMHRIEIEGPNMTPVVRMIAFDKDHDLTFSLSEASSAPSASASTEPDRPVARPTTNWRPNPTTTATGIGLDTESPYAKPK